MKHMLLGAALVICSGVAYAGSTALLERDIDTFSRRGDLVSLIDDECRYVGNLREEAGLRHISIYQKACGRRLYQMSLRANFTSKAAFYQAGTRLTLLTAQRRPERLGNPLDVK